MKPVVGILCCGFDGKNQFVTDTYVRAVRISGGIPLLIPILPQDFPINSYLDICDGFLLPGGGDFTPFLFNEDPLPGVGQTNLSVDLFQIHFAEKSWFARSWWSSRVYPFPIPSFIRRDRDGRTLIGG